MANFKTHALVGAAAGVGVTVGFAIAVLKSSYSWDGNLAIPLNVVFIS
jgi:hypothetical protein